MAWATLGRLQTWVQQFRRLFQCAFAAALRELLRRLTVKQSSHREIECASCFSPSGGHHHIHHCLGAALFRGIFSKWAAEGIQQRPNPQRPSVKSVDRHFGRWDSSNSLLLFAQSIGYKRRSTTRILNGDHLLDVIFRTGRREFRYELPAPPRTPPNAFL